MSKYVEVYGGVKVPDTASHVKPLGMTLFYRIIGGWLEYYSDSKGEWKISEGVLEDVVELPLAEPAINWNEAPDWATCVARADWVDKVVWCGCVAYQYYGDTYERAICENNTFTLIEKRPEPAAWMPEVGQKCEISNCGSDYEVAKVLFMGDYLCIVNHSCVAEQHYHLSSVKFRPLKTEAEKKRDAFIEAAMGLTSDGEQYSVERLAGMMFDNGFKAPGGDQS